MEYLEVKRGEPTLDLLNQLVSAYVHTVPWESASRNMRRVTIDNVYQRPNWPSTFWQGAMSNGTGGTCFESNYAFWSLLAQIGYDGYLTINDMEGHRSGCHTAIVVSVDNQKYLVDVGYPLHLPLAIDPLRTTTSSSRYLDFFVKPQSRNRFHIVRGRHPFPYIFTLLDHPISEGDYRSATAADYHPEGNFNAQVVINKIVDGSMVRFSTNGKGPVIKVFTPIDETHNETSELPLESDLPAQLEALFGIKRDILAAGLQAVGVN